MHLRCTVQLTPLVVRYSRFTQALIPLQLVRQSANPLDLNNVRLRQPPGPHTFPGVPAHLSGSRPAHLSGLDPRTFRAEAFSPFQARLRGAYTLFRAEARAPFQARPRGACAPCRAGLVRLTGRGLCALPGGACRPYRAGLVRPAGRGLCVMPGGTCAPCRAETVRPAGRRLCALLCWAARARTPFWSRASAPFCVSSLTLPDGAGPSTMRVTHTLQSGPGIFSKYLWIK